MQFWPDSRNSFEALTFIKESETLGWKKIEGKGCKHAVIWFSQLAASKDPKFRFALLFLLSREEI